MPKKTEMSITQLKSDHWLMKKLTLPIEEVEKAVEAGEKLVLEESIFSDNGPDYSALFLGDRKDSVAYIPGY